MYVSLYIVLTLFLVFIATRHLNREGFLIANRSVHPWVSAMSLVVSKFGGGKILAGGSLVYLFGWSAMWFNVGFVIGYMLFAKLAFRLRTLSETKKFYTLTDFYRQTVDDSTRWPIGFLCAYTMLGFTCINIAGGAHILSQMTSFPYEIAAVLVTVFVGSYILIGGFKSVIVTDVLQAIVIVLSLTLFIFFAQMPDNMSFNISTFGSDFTELPLIYTFFMGFFFSFGMPEVWPRIYATRTVNDLKQTLPVTVVTYVTLGVILALLILSFRESFPNMAPPVAILSGFKSLLPENLQPLIAVFLFAAVMSSADTYLFQTNAALEQDLSLWDKLFRKWNRIRVKMRISMAVVLLVALASALWLPDIVKLVLLFAAGNFILGVFGVFSRFICLRKQDVFYGSAVGALGIIFTATLQGITFYVPLAAMVSTFLAVVFCRLCLTKA